jgi:ABC-2 type transport system permease protein
MSTTLSTTTVGASRIGYETRSYFRSPDAVFFTFLFPVIMLGIFTAAFSSSGEIQPGPGAEGVSVGAYYLPGMLAAGMLLSGVQNLADEIAGEKSNGTLKRLGGTPLSPVSYFMGKIGQVFVTGALQAGLLLLVAATVLGIALPTTLDAWLTFAWVFVLGITTSALLGIALSALPRSGKSATAVVIPIVLILQFISGVYLQFSQLPEWMQNIASIFPLKWMAQGMRAVFLPDDFKVMEQNGEWDLGLVAIVLVAWLVVGLIVSRVTFRWIRRDA